MALVCSTSQAEVVTYVGTQGPKPNFFTATPPELTGSAAVAAGQFQSLVTQTGGNEFEGAAPTLNFSYGANSAGIASFAGGASIIDGDIAGIDRTLGRYNMTPGVLNGAGDPSYGHWIETSSDLTISLSQGVTALSFFAIDLGDYDGTFVVDLYSGDTLVKSTQLQNTETGPSGLGANMTTSANGNLLFFGATSSDSSVAFTKVVFHVAQAASGPIDVLGFDSFVVGRYNGTAGGNVPEPASLALVGLALAAGGFARRRSAR